jgi:hypothetical protein
MITGYLYRKKDISGISGIGQVAQWILFNDNICVVHWCVPPVRSTVIYTGGLEELKKIHGHDGNTEIRTYDFNPDLCQQN